MAGILLSGPAGSGKTQEARRLLRELAAAGIIVDFQDLYATVLGLERDRSTGRYPERLDSQRYALAVAEYLRVAALSAAEEMELDAIVTNSDGNPARRAFLLGRIGGGATEIVVDPGIDVLRERLSGPGGLLSGQCADAINRWYGRL